LKQCVENKHFLEGTGTGEQFGRRGFVKWGLEERKPLWEEKKFLQGVKKILTKGGNKTFGVW